MNLKELNELFKLIDTFNIRDFSYEDEEKKIKFKKNTFAEKRNIETEIDELRTEKENEFDSLDGSKTKHQIVSPIVGTFYRASTPDSEPLVKVGSVIRKDTIVCVVEAMKLFSEVESEVNGKIIEVLAEDGDLVEVGQPLFNVELG